MDSFGLLNKFSLSLYLLALGDWSRTVVSTDSRILESPDIWESLWSTLALILIGLIPGDKISNLSLLSLVLVFY